MAEQTPLHTLSTLFMVSKDVLTIQRVEDPRNEQLMSQMNSKQIQENSNIFKRPWLIQQAC